MALLMGRRGAQRSSRVERSLAILHDLGVFPELAVYVGELPTLIVDGATHLRAHAAPNILRWPREVSAQSRSSGELAQVWDRLDWVLDDVSGGRPWAIVVSGHEAAVMVSACEAERLRRFERIMRWFSGRGPGPGRRGSAPRSGVRSPVPRRASSGDRSREYRRQAERVPLVISPQSDRPRADAFAASDVGRRREPGFNQ